MEIKASLGKYTVYASDYCKLDSNVLLGGGTNETEILQAILNKAREWGRVKLIMDGAALVSGLYIHSNTTIECLDGSCGFFLESGSDNAILRNAEFSKTEYTCVNVILKGGTYNHNSPGQNPWFPENDWLPENEGCNSTLVPFKFFGVKNFKMTAITIIDQKRYALLMGNWEDVYMENIGIPLPNFVPNSNQDGLHFHAPGKNLVLKNIHGRTGDDFIAINGDEGDRVSDIDGVTIDGVYLKGSTQGIRLLCRERGTFKNVYINNIQGEVDSFAFYINPWFYGDEKSPDFEGYSGKFSNITIENVNLTMKDPVYTYNEQCLFCIGGDIENMRIRNVTAHSNQSNFRLLTLREGYACNDIGRLGASPSDIKEVFIDGVYAKGTDENVKFDKLFAVEGVTKVERLTVKNVTAETAKCDSAFLTVDDTAKVNELNMDSIRIKGFKEAIKGENNCGGISKNDIKEK